VGRKQDRLEDRKGCAVPGKVVSLPERRLFAPAKQVRRPDGN